MMQNKYNTKAFQNILFFITIWIFFSLNSRYFRIPYSDILRWVFLGLLIVVSFIFNRKHSLNFPPILFFFVIAVGPSIFMGINIKDSLIKALSYIVVVWGGYICFRSLDSKDDMDLYLKMMMFIMIAFELQSVFIVLTGKGYNGDRMEGVTTNPNTLGIYSNLSFLASFYWFRKFDGIKKTVFLLLMLTSAYTVIASASRTAFVTLAINIVVAWFVSFKKGSMKLLILIPVAAFLIILWGGSAQKLGITALDRLLNQNEGTTRGELWDKGIMIWKRYPVFGCGYNQSVWLNFDENGFNSPFHNSYLSFLAEVGVWGVVVLGFKFLNNIIDIVKGFIDEVKYNFKVSGFVICFMMIVELLIAAWSESFLFAVGSTEACTFWMLFTWALVYLEKR